MAKIIRQTYPLEVSIGILLLVFALSMFLSGQIFEIKQPDLNEGKNLYLGMFLVSTSVIIMLLILWEEFLFPVKINQEEGKAVYRNHRTKLKKQALIYCIIPAIFIFIYLHYEVNLVRYCIWAVICVVTPVVGKLISGINNYNDFLVLTNERIEFKNNEKVGNIELQDIKKIIPIRDQRHVLYKVQVLLTDDTLITIDLDEMELEAYFGSIDGFISTHYGWLLKDNNTSAAGPK